MISQTPSGFPYGDCEKISRRIEAFRVVVRQVGGDTGGAQEMGFIYSNIGIAI